MESAPAFDQKDQQNLIFSIICILATFSNPLEMLLYYFSLQKWRNKCKNHSISSIVDHFLMAYRSWVQLALNREILALWAGIVLYSVQLIPF